jgi:hypothetical protein
MRVPDEVLKSVVFLGKREYKGSKEVLEFGATAFLVQVPFERADEGGYLYLATAHHAAEKLAGRDFEIRINVRGGHAALLKGHEGVKWWYHPDRSVDVAVLDFNPPPEADFKAIPTSMFLTGNPDLEHGIGPGSEVFITGLFTKLKGTGKNIPIVRTGNVAIVPDEPLPGTQIGNWTGESEVCLIEARSIGGLSGSPVFVREDITFSAPTYRSVEPFHVPVTGQKPCYWFLGLMHGHWEILPERKNDFLMQTTKRNKDTVNLGIAVVVPARKILEVLNLPELVEQRRTAEKDDKPCGGVTEPD